jgi:hypothetical protein
VTIWSSLRQLWVIGLKIDEVVNLQAKTGASLLAIQTRLGGLEDRMTHLEAGQERLVTEAKAAAGAAASGVATTIISDVVTRVTRIEMRQEEAQRRLPPPGPP